MYAVLGDCHGDVGASCAEAGPGGSSDQARRRKIAGHSWRPIPGGYCLFTVQGLLREAVRVTGVLGIDKAAHFEDIVGAVKEPTEFVAAFRKMQQTGEGFTLQIETLKTGRSIRVTGRRFRIGREGPLADALWFAESSPGSEGKSLASSSSTPQVEIFLDATCLSRFGAAKRLI